MIFVIKLTLLQNYTYFTTPDKHFIKTHTQHFIKTHTNIIIFDIFGKTVPLRDLRISETRHQSLMNLFILLYLL